MPLSLRVSIAAACVLLVVYMLRFVIRGKLLLRYSLLWMMLAAVLLVCAVFPQPLSVLSAFFGFVTLSNFIYVVGFVFVLLIVFSLSVIVSKQTVAIKNLTQKIALLEKEIEMQERK